MREFTSVLLGARFHAAVFLDGPLLALPAFPSLPSPLSLSPTNAPAAVSSVALLCLATGFTAFGYAAALLFLSHPSVFPRLSVWPPPPSLHSFPL